mmetsp:Transcript_22651/g.59020  ORF Transcript_22651/g.59020 Transcript_22651/m.59020 type:complete len:97 (+) Transcript_22651:129-419(+)
MSSPTPYPTLTLAPTEECGDSADESSGVTTLQLLLAVIVLTLMLGMGACTRVEDYWNIIKSPRAPLIGFICQFGVMPLLAFAIAEILGVPDTTGQP